MASKLANLFSLIPHWNGFSMIFFPSLDSALFELAVPVRFWFLSLYDIVDTAELGDGASVVAPDGASVISVAFVLPVIDCFCFLFDKSVGIVSVTVAAGVTFGVGSTFICGVVTEVSDAVMTCGDDNDAIVFVVAGVAGLTIGVGPSFICGDVNSGFIITEVDVAVIMCVDDNVAIVSIVTGVGSTFISVNGDNGVAINGIVGVVVVIAMVENCVGVISDRVDDTVVIVVVGLGSMFISGVDNIIAILSVVAGVAGFTVGVGSTSIINGNVDAIDVVAGFENSDCVIIGIFGDTAVIVVAGVGIVVDILID